MNGLPPWVVIVVALFGAGGAGTVALKYFRPQPSATPMELLQEVQEERVVDREERAIDRRKIETLESNMRIVTDYVHQLREHIAEGKPPPPPPWPEGLKS